MNRYFLKKTIEEDTAWLVVTETDEGEVESWTKVREEATPLPYATVLMWKFDLGGEIDPLD